MNNCKLDIFETLEYESPFDRCKLDRKSYALVLTNIIKLYPNGFVLGLNNSWGTGKTTFVKMWKSICVILKNLKLFILMHGKMIFKIIL